MSTSRALRIFRYFVHPGLSSIPLFLGPTGATAKGSHLARANYASGALSPSPFRLAQRFCRPAVTNGTRHRLILDQQNDMVRRIPYSRLTSLFFNAGLSIVDKIALADAASRRPFMGTSVALKKTLPAEAAAGKQAPAGANSLFGSGPGGKPPKRTLSGRFCCDARPLTCYI